MSRAYKNKSLFSDYYLEELAPEDPYWQTLEKAAWEFRQRIANILEKAMPGINGDTPEAEVERRLIRPVLDTLEHIYFVQPAVHSAEGVRRPDYAFFPSREALQKAEHHKGELEFFKTALAVGDAKAWERSLDKRLKGPGDPFTNHNPSYQIDFYLRATDKRWGLLTNGRHWRLYHRDLSYRLDVYYEVDLPQIVTLDDVTFLYFLAFFRREAFQPDSTGECFLDRAYRRSTEYATGLSDELKDNVYEALRLLAEGLLSFPGNNLKATDLDIIRENAFIVIYRLLFILYAEAREFLPVTKSTYLETYSLRTLAHEIASKEPFESKLNPTTTIYWSRLQELFRLINNGDRFLGIPPYNGRLFDDKKEHQHLARWRIGDRYLADAIDQLARAKAAGRTGRGFISYRDLSIRELGSIYEGLLEHRPRYATQDVAVVREDKRERFVPVVELGNRKVVKSYVAGSVYLETDKGERKATGSYYTPDYIVKYIISNTLGPLLKEAKKSDGNLIDAILSIKVLDPAMGSGHFLVEAIDFLARALVEALGADLRETEEDEIRWARREVVERCIYGVDLNPLAVDLAKLSLWLATVSVDKPLNFLDHHLRCGNSLIGARLQDFGQIPVPGKKTAKTAPASQTLLEYYFHQNVATAVDNYFRIASISSDRPQDIQEKEKLYGIARDILKRYREVAHIWTSTYFGNEVPAEGYMSLQDKIRSTDPEWAELEEQPWFAEAVKMGETERRFFHWELEFPEVFFDRNGQRLSNPGFNVAVGNPPYDIELDSNEAVFVDALVNRSQNGRLDSAALFVEQGLQFIRQKGWETYLLPYRLVSRRRDFGNFQKFLYHESLIGELDYLGTVREFESNDEFMLCFLHKDKDRIPEANIMQVGIDVRPEELASNNIIRHMMPQSAWGPPDYYMNIRVALLEPTLLQKVRFVSFPLGDIADSKDGIVPFIRDKLVAYEQKDGRYRRLLGIKGAYWLDRYEVEWGGTWICYDMNEARKFITDPVELRKVQLRDERIFLRSPRIITRQDTISLKGTIDLDCYYHTNSIHSTFIRAAESPYALYFLLALTNSRLLSYYHLSLALKGPDLHPQVLVTNLPKLPIRRIKFTTPTAERERLVEEGKRLYQEYLQTKDWSKVLGFVDERLPQKPDGTPDMEHEQSDVIHDLLAFLAEEMTRLHKEKQVEIKGFLGWLKGYLGVNIEDLKNKTKIKEYHKDEAGWQGFLGALEQNRKVIQSTKGIDVTRREPVEAMQAEFNASVAKLKPVLEAIDLTDKLIDQVVYKLYGLTEEEISVVEGHPL